MKKRGQPFCPGLNKSTHVTSQIGNKSRRFICDSREKLKLQGRRRGGGRTRRGSGGPARGGRRTEREEGGEGRVVAGRREREVRVGGVRTVEEGRMMGRRVRAVVVVEEEEV